MYLRKLAVPLIVGALGLTVAGCTKSASSNPTWVATSTPAATGASPASGSSSSPGSTAAIAALTPTGIAKYQVGAKLTTLKTGKLVTGEKSAPGCPDWVVGKGTGAYAGVDLIFYKGALAWVDVATPGNATEKGIKLGSTYAEVVAAYPSAAKLDDGLGGKAISAHDGVNALFFRFDKDNNAVTMIEAGKAETLEFRFTDGEGC